MESWLPVLGYEDLYEISDCGRVKRLSTITLGIKGQKYTRTEKVLKAAINSAGYPLIGLTKNGIRQNHHVHVLVLEAFVGLRPTGLVGCHRDDNKENNNLSNLRWDTYSENAHDCVVNGNHPEARKIICPRKHPLVNPNIVRAENLRGMRSCLACARAKAYVAYWKRAQPHKTLDLQTVSDQYFQAIMEGES